MIRLLSITFFLLSALTSYTSTAGEEWTCKVVGKSMLSVSSSGKLGSADKGCSCEEMRSFELKTFGEVDEEALKRDFGC
jgi:hypothetical protein